MLRTLAGVTCFLVNCRHCESDSQLGRVPLWQGEEEKKDEKFIFININLLTRGVFHNFEFAPVFSHFVAMCVVSSFSRLNVCSVCANNNFPLLIHIFFLAEFHLLQPASERERERIHPINHFHGPLFIVERAWEHFHFPPIFHSFSSRLTLFPAHNEKRALIRCQRQALTNTQKIAEKSSFIRDLELFGCVWRLLGWTQRENTHNMARKFDAVFIQVHRHSSHSACERYKTFPFYLMNWCPTYIKLRWSWTDRMFVVEILNWKWKDEAYFVCILCVFFHFPFKFNETKSFFCSSTLHSDVMWKPETSLISLSP